MTRKVTANCFRKRLLLLPYANKLFSAHPHYTPLVFEQRKISTTKTTKYAILFPAYSTQVLTARCVRYTLRHFWRYRSQKMGDVAFSILVSFAVPKVAVSLWGMTYRQMFDLSIFFASLYQPTWYKFCAVLITVPSVYVLARCKYTTSLERCQ